MNVRDKLMIYPFDIESKELVEHSFLIDKYVISDIISPSGWGLNGKEIYCDNGIEKLTVGNDFDLALENCDTVFFAKCNKEYDVDKLIYPKVLKAAEYSKNIICCIELEEYMVKTVENICKLKNTSFKYLVKKDFKNICIANRNIYTIKTPVIFVMGMAERTNKFEIQLALKKRIQKMGYKVSQIGTKNYCELMGFKSFPQFMYSKYFTEFEKVVLFNHYIKDIENTEEPDVIIIGVPGGIMPLNSSFTNGFGIIAYEISQAVTPDVTVLSTFYDEFDAAFFEKISKICKYRFGYEIDCYNMASSQYNPQSLETLGVLEYINVDPSLVSNTVKRYNTLNTPVYNILNVDDANNMTSFLINKLEEYGNVEIM